MSFLIAIFAIFLSTLTTIPIIVTLILNFAVVSKSQLVFSIAFLAGLVIDIFYLRILGSTSIFLVIFTFLIYMYQRKFEIQTIPFVAIASFVGSLVYLKVFGNSQVLIQSSISSVLAVLLFKFVMPNLFRHLSS